MKATVQGFAIRDELTQDFEGTVKLIKSLGFDGYEMGMYFGEDHPKVQEEINKVVEMFGLMPGCVWSIEEAKQHLLYMREQGLTIESCHIFFGNAYDTLLEDYVAPMVEFARSYNIKQYVVSLVLSTWDETEQYVPMLKKVTAELEAKGIHLAYHNHDKEMRLTNEGITVLEKLLDSVPGLSLQPDIGWMAAGDGPIEEILTKYADRIYTVHYKDLLIEEWKKGNLQCTAIGAGDVDSLVVKKLMNKMPLMETAMIIDQDNAVSNMMDELKAGKDYIVREIMV